MVDSARRTRDFLLPPSRRSTPSGPCPRSAALGAALRVSRVRSARGRHPGWVRRAALVFATVALVAGGDAGAQRALDLGAAVREALSGNLDLAAQRLALAADREEIAIARAALLPQIDLAGQGQVLEDDRSDGDRGTNTKRSFTVSAKLSQVLYDEADFARLEIQRYVYAAQEQQLEAFRLEVAADAANAFLALDRARDVLEIQRRNRDLTLQNIETSRARIAAGYSSETEILRWESQLATNRADIATAEAALLSARFELNRVRNLPREAAIVAREATIEEYGFVYGRGAIASAVREPDADRRLRDVLVRVGLDRSPTLAESSEAIAAAERQLVANRRAFWVPSLTLVAGVNHLAQSSSTSSVDLDETEWGAGVGLAFPLLQGGAKFANERQTQEYLASLRTQRRADVATVGERLRASFASASAAHAVVGYAREQQRAAGRYFELTDASFVLGVASLIQLIDAQAQRLAAALAYTNALYDFLESMIAAERELSFFPFLEDDAEVTALLDLIEQQLTTGP